MKYKVLIFSFFLLLLTPLSIYADGGIIHWPPDVHLDESAQNAVCAFNGEKEILILSNDFDSNKETTALRIIPLPSKPEITEGSFETFEKLTKIVNQKIEKKRQNFSLEGKETVDIPEEGVEIVFQDKIGAHDLTVVKINDLGIFLNWIENFEKKKNLPSVKISDDFRQGVNRYLLENINYFVFDVINNKGKKSINPLIYKFETNYLYYPLLITGISDVGDGRGKLQLFVITNDKGEKEIENSYPPVDLALEELSSIQEDLVSLFNSSVKVRFIQRYFQWRNFNSDLIVFPYVWKRNLRLGEKGTDVLALQNLLVNYGFWDSNEKISGVFDKETKIGLKKFQEQNKYDILDPLGLKEGTGYFGPLTREFLKKKSLALEPVDVFNRNLYIGIKGDDVLALQCILVSEGVWQEPSVKPTGYFGYITKNSVIKFQEKYKSEVLRPLGLEKGTGFVGPMTRKVLENIYGIYNPKESYN